MTVQVLDRLPAQIVSAAKKVQLAIFDVDGVLTDGKLYYSSSGEEIKTFDIRDGHGLVMLRKAGIKLAIISGRDSVAVERRATELKFDAVILGSRDKLAHLNQLLEKFSLTGEQCSMVGDDLPDIVVMNAVGLSACPAQSVREVKQTAQWHLSERGGDGAVREFCDGLLKAKGLWPYDTAQ
jgi:3-deoxy-D-manno-octulosonate 8-phosphate phosphatase (KDO 8-P phosphatase)